MANKPIEMKQLKAVLRMYVKGHGRRTIARTCGVSKNTVKKYIKLFIHLKLDWESVEKLDESELASMFTRTVRRQNNSRLKDMIAFCPYMHKELRKTGVTRALLWEEYRKKHPDGYKQTQFCEHYSRWNKRVNPTMHVEYKAGDKELVDYCGKKLCIVDKRSGEVKDVEVFVTILGASQLIYVEATESQKKEDLIICCENSFHFYGGVPRALVTDNLKSAVTKSHRYEPKLNPDFADFADHYDTAVIPTRAYKPKDKALVEGAVKIIYQQIYARLRKDTFHSLEELNASIRKHLERVNNRKLSGRPYSRRELFNETEKNVLSVLPRKRFELRTYLQATVLQNGHVCLQKDKHYYSVPYQYIRKKVKVAYTKKQVKIYYRYQCIAVHKRVKSPYNYTTIKDHLASSHRQYTKWNAQYFLDWAASIHQDVELLIKEILEKKQHPEQAYKSCVGVLGLKRKVGENRLIRACHLALMYERYSYKSVLDILERGIDKLEAPAESRPLPSHQNIRGRTYYKSIKNQNQ